MCNAQGVLFHSTGTVKKEQVRLLKGQELPISVPLFFAFLWMPAYSGMHIARLYVNIAMAR
jgi:hypothetical protein